MLSNLIELDTYYEILSFFFQEIVNKHLTNIFYY